MKFKAKDFTFVIPVRVDSQNRIDNLQICVDNLLQNLDTKILIIESDTKPKLDDFCKHHKIDYIFRKNNHWIFHRTMLLNTAFVRTKTKYVVNYDADAYIDPRQLIYAIKALRLNEADFILPYDGNCYDFDFKTKQVLSKLNNCSIGGAVFAKRKVYQEIGWENPNFVCWGSEDNERVKRILKFGKRIKRVTGPFMHLTHPRTANSCDRHPFMKNNLEELSKVCKMNLKDLKRHIKNDWYD